MIKLNIWIDEKPLRKGNTTHCSSSLKSVRVDRLRFAPLGRMPCYEARLTHPEEDAPYTPDVLKDADGTVWRFFRKSENKGTKFPVLKERGDFVEV